MNPIILAMMVALLFGLSTVPWSYTLRVMSSGLFFLGLSAAFLLAGIAQWKQPVVYSRDTILTGLLAIALYSIGMTVSMFMYARTRPEHIPAIVAVLAASVVPAIIVNTIVSRTMPSLIEMILVVIVTAGCVGLGIVGKH